VTGVVELRLPGLLADDAGGAGVHRVDAADVVTVADLLDRVGAAWPRLGRRLRDETGGLRPYVNVYVGQDDVRWGEGLATPVRAGDVVLVLPSVAGG
jgi:molybdopterin converting factor small subunit